MAIQFGIFDHIELRDGLTAAEIYEQRIGLLKRAVAGSFYGCHLVEHHGHELFATPSAAVFLRALARETGRLTLIPTVLCLPPHHRVRLFSQRGRPPGKASARNKARRRLANYFVLMLPFGGLTTDDAYQTLDGFISKVMPAVQETEMTGVSVM